MATANTVATCVAMSRGTLVYCGFWPGPGPDVLDLDSGVGVLGTAGEMLGRVGPELRPGLGSMGNWARRAQMRNSLSFARVKLSHSSGSVQESSCWFSKSICSRVRDFSVCSGASSALASHGAGKIRGCSLASRSASHLFLAMIAADCGVNSGMLLL